MHYTVFATKNLVDDNPLYNTDCHIGSEVKIMFINLFRKECGDYDRYWASVSTEKYDAKKKKGTGEYINATIPVRVVKDETDRFDKVCVKTSNKKITRARFEDCEGFFEAVEPKEGEPFVRFVVTYLGNALND